MGITEAFTSAAMAAFVVHLLYLRRVILNRRAQQEAHIDGDRRRIANAFFYMETTRAVLNFTLIVSGAGILTGHRPFGYLIALIPLLSVTSSAIALRGIR